MPEIRQLTLEELKQIYRTYIKEDFPLMELRGRGIGSAFLAGLIPSIPDIDGIFVEADSPDPEKDEQTNDLLARSTESFANRFRRTERNRHN